MATESLKKAGRYVVGCAGQFVLEQTTGYDDEDVAVAACGDGPPGCEVYDRLLDEWIGPTSKEEIDAAKLRVQRRRSASFDSLIWEAILNAEHHHQLIRWRLERNEKLAEAIREINALYRQRATYRAAHRPDRVRPSDDAWRRTLDRYREAVPLADFDAVGAK